jgi:hypothetical protein
MNYIIIDETPISGLRRVKANNRYGLIDNGNNIVCEIIYDDIDLRVLLEDEKDRISDKRIRILQNRLWGFIDDKGKSVIPPQFYNAERFNDRYATVGYCEDILNKGDCYYYNLIDRVGNTVLSQKWYDDIRLYGIRQQYALLSRYHFSRYKDDYLKIYYWDFVNLEREYRDTPEFVNCITRTCKNSPKIIAVSSSEIKIMTEKADYIIDVLNEKVIQINNLSFMEKSKRSFSEKIHWK